MVSITRYISEGFLADKLDKANTKIDNFLGKSSVGRAYMGAENATGKLIQKGGNILSNNYNRLLRRNFKVKK